MTDSGMKIHLKHFRVPEGEKVVSQIVANTLEGLGMRYPETTPERARQLQSIRAALVKEAQPE